MINLEYFGSEGMDTMRQRSAEILCIGTEILMGDIVNTNAAYIAKELAGLGINVYHQSVVGDNPQRLREALELAFSRADIVITTGGLGPTYDDLSKETIAAFFGRELVMDQESLHRIECHFLRQNRPMTENNKKQAMMPQGCIIFPNNNGTAPGCAIEGTGEQQGKTAIMLPGPPREMKPMFEESVKPFLLKDSDTRLVSHTMHFFGIGESMLESLLRDLMEHSLNPTVAPYAKTGEVQLRVTARVQNGEDAEALLQPVVEKIKEQVGGYLYGIDVGDLQTAAVHALKASGLHVAVAESCTGGYVAKRLTDVSGASEVFECGVVTYSNRMKHHLLGVSQQTLDTFGAVSEETAREMAAGVRKLSGAEIGISVTGNAGPEPSEGKEVGLVYIGVDSPEMSRVFMLQVNRRDQDARETIRYLASSHALSLILKAVDAMAKAEVKKKTQR